MTTKDFIEFCRRHEIGSRIGAFLAVIVVALLIWGSILKAMGEL